MEFWTVPEVINAIKNCTESIKRALRCEVHDIGNLNETMSILQQLMESAPDIADDVNIRRVEYLRTTCALISSHCVTCCDIENPSSPETKASTREDLDSFAESRRKAIESTMVTDCSNLPRFSDIAGLSEAKNVLIEALVDPLLYPEWFNNSDLRPWKALLLFGPPGTGKSALAQATVREIGAVLYQVSSSDLISSWSGQSEKLIRELFDQAASSEKTVVVFIDEIDSLCRKRSSLEEDANRRVKTELLVQIQKLHSSTQVILLCATNCPWDLDPAFMRRFEKKIYVGLPDKEARREILQKRLEKTTFDANVDLNVISEKAEGFSGDDLRRLCSELAYLQFRFYKEERNLNPTSNARKPLTFDDVSTVLSKFVRTVDERQLLRFRNYLLQ